MAVNGRISTTWYMKGPEGQQWPEEEQYNCLSRGMFSRLRNKSSGSNEQQLCLNFGDLMPNLPQKSGLFLSALNKFNFDIACQYLCDMTYEELFEIVTIIPIDSCIDHVPNSLRLIKDLYNKLFSKKDDASEVNVKKTLADLHKDRMLLQLVQWLSINSDMSQSEGNNYYLHLKQCAEILQIINILEPNLRNALRTLIRGLRRCVDGLGGHGLVQTSELINVTIQEALKIESQHLLTQLKSVIQKIEDELGSKRISTGTCDGGNTLMRKRNHHQAPVWASHQRMLQVTEDDVKHRLLSNKSLLIQLDPIISNNSSLKRLVHILEHRIDCDKETLVHFGDLKRNFPQLRTNCCLISIFQQFICGFEKVAALLEGIKIEEISNFLSYVEDDSQSPSDLSESGYDIVDTESSTRLSARPSSYSSGSCEQGRPLSPMAQSNGVSASTVSSSASDCNVHSDDQTKELYALKSEVVKLQRQLAKSEDTVKMLQERERMLLSRLSEQVRNQFDHGSSKFEDLSLGDNRPSQLISRYGNLFSQARVDAVDALDELEELSDFDDLKGKLLFSVVVLAFRCVQHSIQKLRTSLRNTLALPERATVSSQILEDSISTYLKKSTDDHDISHNVQEVCTQLWTTLYDYPTLKHCAGLKMYVEECVRLAWALSVQTPPFVIEYDAWQFDDNKFVRFHTSNSESNYVKSILWPALLEGEGGACVFKGIVIT